MQATATFKKKKTTTQKYKPQTTISSRMKSAVSVADFLKLYIHTYICTYPHIHLPNKQTLSNTCKATSAVVFVSWTTRNDIFYVFL